MHVVHWFKVSFSGLWRCEGLLGPRGGYWMLPSRLEFFFWFPSFGHHLARSLVLSRCIFYFYFSHYIHVDIFLDVLLCISFVFVRLILSPTFWLSLFRIFNISLLHSDIRIISSTNRRWFSFFPLTFIP